MVSDQSRGGYDPEDPENDTKGSAEGSDTVKKIAVTVALGVGAYVVYKILK